MPSYVRKWADSKTNEGAITTHFPGIDGTTHHSLCRGPIDTPVHRVMASETPYEP